MSPFDPHAGHIHAGGVYRMPDDARLIDCLDPADLSLVGRIAECDHRHVDLALEPAIAAQREWQAMDAKARATLIHRLADRIEAEINGDSARLMTAQMGKPYSEAVGEMMNVAPIFRYFAEMARDDGGFIAGGGGAPGSLHYARYFPYGVSLHIVPYNFPIILMAFTLAASISAGNAAVVKPAPATSLCSLAFMRCFDVLPKGLVSCLTGGRELARALITDERVNVVAFTGSVEAGREVAALCGQHLKPSVIEAGGSDPLIVMDSADIEIAAAACLTGAFHLSGQICTSTERIYVHERVHDRFVEAMTNRASRLRVGPGMENVEIGPLVSEAHRARVMALVDGAIAGGARLVHGGRIPPGRNVGWFYEPTILADISGDMSLLQSEVFGPVAPIQRVASLEEAIRWANRSRFGLGAAIFTASLEEAMAAADRLQAGMVWINNILGDNDALPFGGWKQSGLGRALSRLGLNHFRQSKMVMLESKAELQSWWYPYSDGFYRERGGGRI